MSRLLLRRKCDESIAAGVVFASGLKGIFNERGHTHSSIGISAAAFDVLAQCELDAGFGILEPHVFDGPAPAELDDGVLATNRIGGSVQLVRGRQSTGKLAEKIDVIRVNHVADPHLRRVGLSAFVDAPGDSRVAVTIDESGCDMHAGPVDHQHVRVIGDEVAADRDDLPFLNQQIRIF